MLISYTTFNGDEITINVESFQFRKNQVTNWLKLKHLNGTTEYINDICVIKPVSINVKHNIDGLYCPLCNNKLTENKHLLPNYCSECGARIILEE